jgi:hypothetical protein
MRRQVELWGFRFCGEPQKCDTAFKEKDARNVNAPFFRRAAFAHIVVATPVWPVMSIRQIMRIPLFCPQM